MSRPLRTLVLCALLAVAGGWCALKIFSSDARGRSAAAQASPTEIAERPPAVLETPAAVEREVLEPEAAPAPARKSQEAEGDDGPAVELDWFARILDGQTGVPLAGVQVARIGGEPFDPFDEPSAFADAPSDASGLVRLRFPSQGTFFARAELAGHSTAYAQLEPGHGSPSASFTLLLFRAATLELHATNLGGAVRADLRLRVTHTSDILQTGFALARIDETVLETRTDALGTAVLEDVPANVPLTVQLLERGVLVREERELRLEPGERRTLEWSFGTGCTLEGLALESDGNPAADVLVWLLPDDGDLNVGDRRSGDVIASARSAADGSFAFERVRAGSWYVCAQPAVSEIASLAVPVLVLPQQPRATVTLTCWRGLYMRGRVIGPDDEVPERSHVFGILAGSAGGRFVVDAETEGGEFSLGPLVPGSFTVSATGFGGPFSDSAVVTIEAGAEGVVLRLGHGTGLDVEVFDARGKPARDTLVWVLAQDDGVGSIGMMTDAEGKAGLDGRRPGVYTLSASTPAGEFVCVRGVQLVAGAATPIELRMEPAARLRLRVPPERARGLSVRVLQDGHPIAFGLLGGDPLVTVPPGELELLLARWGDVAVIEHRRVLAVLGEETEVVFEGEAPR